MPTITGWLYIINLGVFAALAGMFCIGDADAASIFIASLWLGSPYLGHCALAYACSRDRGASALVFALTLANVVLVLHFLIFPPPGIASPDGQDDENGLGFVFLALPVLQWILVVIAGIVLLLSARGRAAAPLHTTKFPPLDDLE